MKFPDRVLTLIEQEIEIESNKELLAGLVHECPVMLEGIIGQKRSWAANGSRKEVIELDCLANTIAHSTRNPETKTQFIKAQTYPSEQRRTYPFWGLTSEPGRNKATKVSAIVLTIVQHLQTGKLMDCELSHHFDISLPFHRRNQRRPGPTHKTTTWTIFQWYKTFSLDRLDRKLALGLKTSLPEPESSSWNISDIVIIDLKSGKEYYRPGRSPTSLTLMSGTSCPLESAVFLAYGMIMTGGSPFSCEWSWCSLFS